MAWRAARWLASNGHVGDALRHAATAGAWETAAGYIVDSLAVGRLLVGLLRRDHGSVLLAGRDPARLRPSELARLAGYVFQAVALANGLLAVIQPLLVTTIVFALPLRQAQTWGET